MQTIFSAKADLQQIRRSALSSQLLALKAQARAIKSIGVEHADGLDLADNVEVDWLVKNAQDFSDSALNRAKEFEHADAGDTAKALETLLLTCQDIESRVGNMNTLRHEHAHERMVDAINALFGGEPPAASDEDPVPSGSKQLEQRAHMSCFSAESEQYSTFGMQVLAVCHLAMEIAFNAAAQAEKRKTIR